ncbi:MAG TPA: FtsL-like putative cell division protein [Chitinophagales bacterium]|nr:FtsL-like putative cell division protein [Chitinophagales bacterium]HNB47721.1 FtsL-like putative cell division protein [Chitinophagales bacterium]
MEENELHTTPTPQPNAFQRIVETVLHVFGIDDFISYAQVIHNFLFIAAIVFIGVLEIFNTHLSVRFYRGINKKQEAVKELRWEYMTVKTEMNQKSKQSVLQTVLEPTGLKTLKEPPKKIEVRKGTLEQ